MRKYGEYGKINKRGNIPAKGNKSGVIATSEDREIVRKIVEEAIEAFVQKPVGSDEELMTRISDYFDKCTETGQTPTIEELILCTGHTQTWWVNVSSGVSLGFSPETRAIIEKATMLLKTIDAKLVVAGKMNFLAYCFRAKNYYGMTDKVEHVLTPNYKESIEFNPDDIAKKYGIEGYTAKVSLPEPPSDSEKEPSDSESEPEPEPLYVDL